ncbi:MAG: septal ring lytic transglycosylase RlpA family protein [Candidatus Aminicenantes bacterium]|nr:septal ring lytic transglycosylase RlpA family protein [Candidatus Aminicenantes bacterium]NIM80729.1 septal ring lytic transglycosylase RlpA family protein [Candidatus Aminicenantes bacterium]NIN20104.1 septal ring lytic transglycosylase RlpA family protein [Candidatus Aminicenantes bacterium]NIN43891.1 septal ring lytic transglycosylase RlpA family protein [Candidatus Aminicenantes bacterium]NIN86700.1 septal ring lytic transglycosylase RlpA family protein [Candidatus Aminicenantes bacteri
MPRLFCLLLTVLLLNFCSGRGDNWDILTEPEQPKEEQKEKKESSKPETPEQQEREEITVTPVKEKPGEVELKELEEAKIVSNEVFQTGIASWYGDGDDFHGKRTANGEIYDMDKLTAAHKTLPFHTLVEVENVDNGKKVTVRINDRGPFIEGRIIDLSRKAAKRIGIYGQGTAPVHLRVVKLPDSEKTVQFVQPTADKQPTDLTETDSTVITKSDTSPPVSVNVQPISQGTFYLQAGAFGSMKNAKRLLRRIKAVLPEVPFKIEMKDGLYKIVSDWLSSREAAEKLKDRLEKSGIDSFIREE